MNLLHVLKENFLIMIDGFLYSGPLPREFLSAFWKSLPRQIVRVGSVHISILNLQEFDSVRQIKCNELHTLNGPFICYYLLLSLSKKTCKSPYNVDHLEGN